ncbi:MAG: NAD-dependent epimerase/dehydratase family protein [Candidatus Flexifilum sp.]|jgi:nucleoside-diphosphate-sugar epimerase
MESPITTSDSGQTSVFIVGGMAGLGRELARALVGAGHRVSATCTTARGAAALRADGVLPVFPDIHHAGELRSAIQGTQSRVIVNLAPQSSNLPPQLNAAFDPDLAAHTRTIVSAAVDAGCEFFIHTSYAFLSGHVHGADADDVLEPVSAVLDAARAAETVALSSSIPACVLRFGYLYGADSDELKRLAAALKGAGSVPAGEAHARAAWLHHADAARAVALTIARRPVGQTLVVSDGHPAAPAEFMQYFASAQGLSLGGGLPLPFLSRTIKPTHQALMKLDAADVTPNAVEALGWTPRYADYRQGIDEVLLAWRASLRFPQPEA